MLGNSCLIIAGRTTNFVRTRSDRKQKLLEQKLLELKKLEQKLLELKKLEQKLLEQKLLEQKLL